MLNQAATVPTKVEFMDPELVMAPIQLEGPAGEVFDKIPVMDVVWDEERLQDLDSHDGLLRQLAQGGELMGGQQKDSNLLYGLLKELAQCGDYLVDEKRKLMEEPDLNIKPTMEISTSPVEGCLDEMSRKDGTEQIVIRSPAAYDGAVCVMFEKMTCVHIVLDEDLIDELDTNDSWLQEITLNSEYVDTEKTKLNMVYLCNDKECKASTNTYLKWSCDLTRRYISVNTDMQLSNRAIKFVFSHGTYLMDIKDKSWHISFRQWDPGIPSYTAAGTYAVSSSVLFIQNSFMLLVPLLEVLNPAYLKTELTYSALSISTSIWLKLGVILMTSGLKTMVFRLFSQEEKCNSVRSERQQADLGDDKTDVQLWTGGSQEIQSITDSLTYEHQIMILKSSYISIIRQWDPGIAKFRLHEAGDDSLNGRMWAAEKERASFAYHSVAWGQATFWRGGSVTPALYAILWAYVLPSPGPQQAKPKYQLFYIVRQISEKEMREIFRNENWVHPFLRRLPHGGEIPVSSSSVSLVGDALSRAHVPAVARRRPRVVTCSKNRCWIMKIHSCKHQCV